MTRSKLAVRLAAVAAVIAVFLVVRTQIGLPDVAQMRAFFDDLGWIAPVVFVVLYAAITVFLLPASVFTIGAGAVFGFWSGLGLVLTGAILGATIAFAASRWLGRDSVRGLTSERVRWLDEQIGERGFATVFVARLVPVIPFVTINYAFGLTAVAMRSYVLATAIGIVPGTAIYVAVGAYGFSPGSWPFIAAVMGLGALTGIGVVHARRTRAPRAVAP